MHDDNEDKYQGWLCTIAFFAMGLAVFFLVGSAFSYLLRLLH